MGHRPCPYILGAILSKAEPGSTSIKAVRRHLMAEPELHDRLLGVVLNKANLKLLERFEQHGVSHNGYYVNRGYRLS